MNYTLRDYYLVSVNEEPVTITGPEDVIVQYIQEHQPGYFDYSTRAKDYLASGEWETLSRLLYTELGIDLIKNED